MKKELEKRNFVISELLDQKIKECLESKNQVILLLNRRGFSTFITCSNCGFTYKCPHCEISLTYHKSSNTLRCHYCGYTKIKDDICPKCGEAGLNYMGMGTEKLEDIIKEKVGESVYLDLVNMIFDFFVKTFADKRASQVNTLTTHLRKITNN